MEFHGYQITWDHGIKNTKDSFVVVVTTEWINFLLNLTSFVLKSKISIFRQNIGFNLLWYMPPIAKRKKVTMLKNNNRSMTFKIQNTSIGRQQHEHHLRTKSGYWISPPATMFAHPLHPACLYSPWKLKYLTVLAALSPTKTCTSVGWTIAIHGNWC